MLFKQQEKLFLVQKKMNGTVHYLLPHCARLLSIPFVIDPPERVMPAVINNYGNKTIRI
jgi:hypothetical protein